jgi:predicted metal-dependent peptidase|tara:strand:+ start:906 stop:1169 length:264 start_codon:yes stop_codon:yes gene_type:complete
MKKRTRSILEELNNVYGQRNNDYSIDAAASNIIESSINLLQRINDTYDNETALDLERRFLNSIRSGDPRKFRRYMKNLIESRKTDGR